MANKEDILQMRNRLPDSVIMEAMYSQDADFRFRVDQFKTKLPEMSALAKSKFPSAMLNKHYFGSFEPVPQKQSTATKMAQSLISTKAPAPAQEEKGFIAETASNILPSAGRLAKDVGTGIANIFNPDLEENTLANLSRAAVGGVANLIEVATGNEELFDLKSEEIASGIGQFYKDRYGGAEAAAETLKKDPVGFLADVAMVFAGAGGLARGAARAGTKGAVQVSTTGAAAKVGRAGTKATQIARRIDPVENAARLVRKFAQGTKDVGKFTVSQATGFSPETISTIIGRTEDFTSGQLGKITREGVAAKVEKAIGNVRNNLSSTGKEYQLIRASNQVTDIPDGFFRNILQNQGIKISKANKIVSGKDATIRLSQAERGQLTRFLKDWIDVEGTQITANQFLNLRDDLSKISKFDSTAPTRELEALAKIMRKQLNETARAGITGLDDLDARFAPIIDDLSKLEREFIDKKTGELKHSVTSKVAALNNRGKELLRNELSKTLGETFTKKLFKDVDILNAIKNVEDANGVLVATYVRSGLGVGGALTANPSLIVAAILATPQVSIKLMKLFGKAQSINKSVVDSIVSKLRSGTVLAPQEAKIFGDMLRQSDVLIKESMGLLERSQ